MRGISGRGHDQNLISQPGGGGGACPTLLRSAVVQCDDCTAIGYFLYSLT